MAQKIAKQKQKQKQKEQNVNNYIKIHPNGDVEILPEILNLFDTKKQVVEFIQQIITN